MQPRLEEKPKLVRDEMRRGVRRHRTQPDIEKQVRAQDRLRLTLDTIPALVHTAQPDGSCDYFNQRWLDYLGVSLEDIKGWGWTSRIHPDDTDAFVEGFRSSIGGGEPFEAEARVRRHDGFYRWMVHRKVPLRDEQGRVIKWYGSSIDIDELKRSEFYLAEGQRLSRAGSWSFKPDLTCDYWSHELYEILGFDPTDGVPTIPDYLTRIHPLDRKIVEATIQRMIAAGEGCDLKKRIIRPDGAHRVIRCVGTPVRENGIVTRFVGTLMDITDQEKLTEELRRRETCLAEAQRLSHTGSFDWNVLTGELTWSEENYRILGCDRSIKPSFELIRDRVHPDDLQIWQQAFARATEGKEVDCEHRLVMPDGCVKFLHVVAYGVQKDGKHVELVGTAMDITERKRAEETIRRNEAYLAEAQRLSKTGSFAWNPATDNTYYSAECYRVLGFEPQEGPPPRLETVLQRIHPDDRVRCRELVAKAVREKVDVELDYRVVHPDKRVRDVHCVSHVVLDRSGELVEMVGTVIDVTERKRAEDELRASEAKYRHLVDTIPAFVHTALPNGDVDFYNRGWLEYVGLPLKLLQGWGWIRMIHPEDVQTVVPNWRAALGAGRPFVGESRVRRADGEYRWFLHREEPLRNEAGEIVKWYGTSIEIEERKVAEESIRRSEAFLAEGQRLSHTGSWGWNASTGKVTWSQELFRILGLDPQQTNPSLDLFWDRVHPSDRPGFQRTFAYAIRDKTDFEQEFRIVTPDWSIRHLHGVGHAILNEANELVEFIGSTMDITERKRAEERAQSQREAIRLALDAFVEKLDVDRFLGDVIAELTTQVHAQSWELWLFDEAVCGLMLHSSSHPSDSPNPAIGSRNARPPEELQSTWQIRDDARAPQILQLSARDSLVSRRHAESLIGRGIKTLMIVPLALGKQNVGFLELHFDSQTQFTSDDLELAQALANHATLALQLNRLTRRAEQLAVTEERNRLAREIHDTLAQAFAGVVLHSEVLLGSLAGGRRRSANALAQIQKLARSGLEEARRSVQALRPKALDGTTLPNALRQAAMRLNDDAKLSCEFKQRGKRIHLSDSAQNELFRIGQEALTNVVKHAQARTVCISLVSQARRVTLSIKDDGIGFATAKPRDQNHGFGMGTMRERAQEIGGRLRVETRPGKGTTIRVEVPSSANRSKRKKK